MRRSDVFGQYQAQRVTERRPDGFQRSDLTQDSGKGFVVSEHQQSVIPSDARFP